MIVIVVVGVVQFQSEPDAADSEKTFSGRSTVATPETPHINSKEPAGERKGDFSQGRQYWHTYFSAAGFDHGKGEMYALHLGYEYFFVDDFSVNVDLLGGYIRSGIDDNGAAIGLDVLFRRHQFKSHDNLGSLFFDLGAGLQQQSTNFAGSRKFNFRLLGGVGASLRVAVNARLMAGIRYLHISDAGIEGGGGGFDGFQFYAGSMFAF